LIKAYRDNAVGLEAALQVVRDLPLEKRYTWRVFSALRWAFADFEDEYIGLDLPHIPEPTRSEMTKELELRLHQLRMLLETFHTEWKVSAPLLTRVVLGWLLETRVFPVCSVLASGQISPRTPDALTICHNLPMCGH
jgi:hypothetical protein